MLSSEENDTSRQAMPKSSGFFFLVQVVLPILFPVPEPRTQNRFFLGDKTKQKKKSKIHVLYGFSKKSIERTLNSLFPT